MGNTGCAHRYFSCNLYQIGFTMLSIFMKKLTVNEAKNKVTTSDNAVLIDCRPKEDYAHGHVAGAINFPIEKITEERVCRRLPDKTTGLYIIGSYYHKPNVAMKKFKKLGYKNLHFSGFMEEHHGMLTR